MLLLHLHRRHLHIVSVLRRDLHHRRWHHLCVYGGLHWHGRLHMVLCGRIARGLLVLSLFGFLLLSDGSVLAGLNSLMHAFARAAHLLPILMPSMRNTIVARGLHSQLSWLVSPL